MNPPPFMSRHLSDAPPKQPFPFTHPSNEDDGRRPPQLNAGELELLREATKLANGSTPNNSYGMAFKKSSAVSGADLKLPANMVKLADKLQVMSNRKPNYKGEMTIYDLLNATTSPEENTALYVSTLPGDVTMKEIYAVISHGQVHSSSLLPPSRPEHQFSVMRLVFMTRIAAEKFLADINSQQGIMIRDCRLTATWNRERVGPLGLERYQGMTRCLRIIGPKGDFNKGTLIGYLRKYIDFPLTYESEAVLNNYAATEKKEMREIVLHFGSIRSQAEAAIILLRETIRKYATRPEEFMVTFVADPCDRKGNGTAGSQM